MNKKANSELFSSILYIIVGVILAIFQGETLDWAMTIAGIVFIVSGALDLIKQNWKGGGISVAIGIAIILLGWLAVDIVIIALGVLIAIKGIIALIDVFKKSDKNLLDFLFPVLTVVLGIALAFGNLLSILFLIVGILLAINGVIGLINSLKK